jgi:uncharacterized lipoprotein YddW (UPF0748 family)
MKKILLTLFLIITISAQSLQEFRAVKITDIDSQILFTDENIAGGMDYLESINTNVVLVVVLNGGWTQYPSAVMDSLFGKSIETTFYGRDPLERILIEAHRNGIEVYPWFEYGFASWYSGGTAPFGGHILAKFPEWACRTIDGKIATKNGFDWMSPINPDVQNFINSLVEETLNNYDIDGVEFSDRIPAMPVEGGYDSVTVELYKADHSGNLPPTDYNNSAWKRWRADKMNQWYRDVRELTKSYGEYHFVSSSPSIYPWGYDNYLQDAKTWIDEDIVDHFIPQLYRYDFNSYLYELNQAVNQVGNDKLDILFPGILMNIGTGSNAYVMSDAYLTQAIQANRSKGLKGEAYFFYEGLRKNNDQLGNLLKDNFYQEKAVVPGRNGIWRPKADIVNETDLNAKLIGAWDNYQMAGYDGTILRNSSNSEYAAVEYSIDVKFPAYFDIYTYSIPNTIWTKNANYTIYGASDSVMVTFDQSNTKKKGWQKLTTVYLEEGLQKVIKLDNSQLEDGKHLISDAVMIMINRKLSPDVVVTSVEESDITEETPSNYILMQNYPNPFNPSTSIEYSVPISQYVSLKVYDILGNQVAELVNERKDAGRYEVNFNASNLSSGVYFYKITAGNHIETKKMMLIK